MSRLIRRAAVLGAAFFGNAALDVAIVCAAILVACTAQQQATVTNALATAQQDAQEAITVYGVAKGIAQVAETAQPQLAPAINAAIAVLDPLVAQASAALADSGTDAAALETLASTIKGQVASLTVTAAPAVKVVPATASAT